MASAHCGRRVGPRSPGRRFWPRAVRRYGRHAPLPSAGRRATTARPCGQSRHHDQDAGRTYRYTPATTGIGGRLFVAGLRRGGRLPPGRRCLQSSLPRCRAGRWPRPGCTTLEPLLPGRGTNAPPTARWCGSLPLRRRDRDQAVDVAAPPRRGRLTAAGRHALAPDRRSVPGPFSCPSSSLSSSSPRSVPWWAA